MIPFIQLIGEVKLFITIARAILFIFRVILATVKYLVWEEAAALTWTYFWRRGIAEVVPVDGKTPEEIYQEALINTKEYMKNEAWDQFKELFFMPAGLVK